MTAKGEKQGKVLRLEGELTVIRAAELKEMLRQSLAGPDSVEIDLDQVTAVDLACLQLFCSAHKTALRDDRKWRIKNMGSSVLQTAGMEAGFSYHTKCRFHPTVDCLWRENDES